MQFFCRVAENPCPLDQQISTFDYVFQISTADIALAMAVGFSLTFIPVLVAGIYGSLLNFIDGK